MLLGWQMDPKARNYTDVHQSKLRACGSSFAPCPHYAREYTYSRALIKNNGNYN